MESCIPPSPSLLLLSKPNNIISPIHLKQIHAHLLRTTTHIPTPLLTSLLRRYSTISVNHHPYAATALFRQFPHPPPTFAFNLLIRSHTINGLPLQSISLYNDLIIGGEASPDKFTFSFVVKACGEIGDVEKGKEVHGFAIKSGFWKDLVLMNNVMDCYFKCGEIGYARKVFDKMSVRSVVSWTIAVAGLVRGGMVREAWRVFEEMPERNVVSWSVMIDGFVENEMPGMVFELFGRMMCEGVRPNEHTLVSLLRVCAKIGSSKLGALVHEFVVKNGFELGVYLGTALIDMYSKCGSLKEARRVFDKMEKKSVVTWNAMITSLGVHGCGEEVLILFDRMLGENVQPDAITFVGVLSACVQTRNVDRGLRLFKYMIDTCGILPILEHYICMFQLWNLEKAMQPSR